MSSFLKFWSSFRLLICIDFLWLFVASAPYRCMASLIFYGCFVVSALYRCMASVLLGLSGVVRRRDVTRQQRSSMPQLALLSGIVQPSTLLQHAEGARSRWCRWWMRDFSLPRKDDDGQRCQRGEDGTGFEHAGGGWYMLLSGEVNIGVSCVTINVYSWFSYLLRSLLLLLNFRHLSWQ
jgi:hypothetical protein